MAPDRAASQAISAPELPAPTTRTRLPASSAGDLYRAECQTWPRKCSWPGQVGMTGCHAVPGAAMMPE